MVFDFKLVKGGQVKMENQVRVQLSQGFEMERLIQRM